MKKLLLTCGALSLIAGAPVAQAAVATYNVTTRWYEPDTQPRDSIFIGSFSYDDVSHTVTGLTGILSESMSGDAIAYPNDNMAWLTLNNQLANGDAAHTYTWHDAALGGTFATVFRNTNSNTFTTMLEGDGWSPQAGVDAGGIYYGYPRPANNPENAYAMIFVPDSLSTANTAANPLTLAWNENAQTGSLGLAHTAYADCVKLSGPGGVDGGGMMGAVCMTATSVAAYGAIGTMSGYPIAQTITAVAVPVPEPEAYAMMLAGLGVMGLLLRRRRQAA